MGLGNPFKGLEKDIKRGLNKLGDSIKSSIRNTGRDIENNVKSVAHQAEDGIKHLAREAEESLEKAADDAKEEIEDAAEAALEVAQQTAQAALQELSRKSLTKIVDGFQVLMPSSIPIQLGPFVLEVGNITERVDTLQKWAKNPPSSKHDIRAIIEEVAPTSVGIDLSISVALVVVNIDSLTFGACPTYETKDFLDKFEVLLEHYGINI